MAERAPRYPVIDLARGIALVAMATFHFSWDLEFFGYLEPRTTLSLPFVLYARAIASSFLFLAGVSLVLAHSKGIRWKAFLRRFGMVAGAAAAITLATLVAVPDGFIFFGILHMIAFASLAGLLFLRLPFTVTLLAGLAVIALPQVFRSDAMNGLAFWWTGLHTVPPRSNDFVPVFPFFGPFLIGMAVMQWLFASGRTYALDRIKTVENPIFWGLQLAGRHSLAVYLIHQPVLIALVWLATQVIPPAGPDPVAAMVEGCVIECSQASDVRFCTAYCNCVMDEVLSQSLFNDLQAGRIDPGQEPMAGIVEGCTASAME